MKVALNGGKYEYVTENGNQAAYRHGEMWRDLTGDNFIYAMACKINDLERERNELAAQVERLRSAITPKVIDLIRCGIGSNYSGSLFDNAMNEYREPLVLAISEPPPAALAALKDSHFREFCDCNVTARKMQMAASKGLKITGFLTDDGKCCIDGKVQPLEELKAQWQAEIISELKIHMTKNGYRDEADGVGAWFKERQITQEVGDE